MGLGMGLVLVATGVGLTPSGASAGGTPIAVPRDLGTGQGTGSRSVALAGRVAVGTTSGVPSGSWLFSHDLDAPGATMQQLDDGSVMPGLSTITDADGPYVVGGHQVGTASRSAYVHDLRTRTTTSLDRFGGLLGSATAVDAGTVVGSAEVAPGRSHGFAYDVDGARAVLDLGTLGGPESTALDVSGDVVVGQADGADLAGHGFVVDLAAPGRPMTGLGTFGGAESAATAVSGDLVVGWAEDPRGARQAFAVRRSALAQLTPIGSLGGPTSEATGVDGDVVVGTSTRADGSVGIWWTDVRTAPYVLHDLGTQAEGTPTPRVLGGKVIGTRRTPAGDRAFVADTATGSLLELDPLPGHDRTEAADLAGDVVVGTSYAGGSARATAWTLGTVAPPSVALARKQTRVSEGKVARIKVVRSGDLRAPAEVRYRFVGTRHGAKVRKDLRRTRGVVRFEPGRSTAWIRVKVRNDRIRERAEKAKLRIRVTAPADASVGRSRARLVIRASDRRRGRR
jgi:probable HAF family extracellular repeat protein